MDTTEVLSQVGVAGILIVLVLRMVFEFLTKKKTSGPAQSYEDLRRACVDCSRDVAEGVRDAATIAQAERREQLRMIKDLHEWHSKTDGDGVKIWYVRSSLETAVKQLADAVAAQTKFFEKFDRDLKDIKAKVDAA